jgi:amino acid transporter
MGIRKTLKNIFVGKARNLEDRNIFQHISLIALFAWVGLGADGLSSSCYGPEQAFIALGEHKFLGIFVAILTALTVFLISASYEQIIELFPTGGGGYLVASKLINPTVGMVAGCALLIDFVLTIAISVASGTDAIFSFLPAGWLEYRLDFALLGVFGLMLLNMRGVKESVIPLVPLFLTFLVTHSFTIIYSLATHVDQLPQIINSSMGDIENTRSQIGLFGVLFIILRAYSLGAGTFTGIEAVSNGLSILREPREQTGKLTMRYMSFSLAFTVAGLMLAYLLFDIGSQPTKTLNAVLFENMTAFWPVPWGQTFVLVTLVSEAMLLLVAAQAGFLGGPAVLANMALDRWMPSRFSSLSDRLVTQNGVILMGLAALITVAATQGSVHLLVVLYSINVFITFCLSQTGMVRHWWSVRNEEKRWLQKILINGLGLLLTTFILISVIVLKFNQGGWITLLLTSFLVLIAILIRRHYRFTLKMLRRLNPLVETAWATINKAPDKEPAMEPGAKTAVILVNGFNGLGLHTLMAVIRMFGKEFKNIIFLQIGVINAGNFKGIKEVDHLKSAVKKDLTRYVTFMKNNGYYAEGCCRIGTEVTEEVEILADEVNHRFPGAVFFSGQLVFPQETFADRLLHNYTVFSIQRRLHQKGIPFIILPIRV